jgi:Lon protease-like protein
MNDSSAQTRLFPLPNLVFFPHVMQPLHIFEPRYRQMTADALAGDRRIALVLPQPGWEKDYAGRPPIHPVACVGQIVAEQRLHDGRFNILLRGQERIRILEEIPGPESYRLARAEIIEDVPIVEPARARCWRKTLRRKVPVWFPEQAEIVDQLNKLLHGDLPLGALCDIIAFALPLEAEFKQTLLQEGCVATRLQRLHDFLDTGSPAPAPAAARPFPPEFSLN